jgi:hypothetical protein
MSARSVPVLADTMLPGSAFLARFWYDFVHFFNRPYRQKFRWQAPKTLQFNVLNDSRGAKKKIVIFAGFP